MYTILLTMEYQAYLYQNSEVLNSISKCNRGPVMLTT
jgi:hypothetical protein